MIKLRDFNKLQKTHKNKFIFTLLLQIMPIFIYLCSCIYVVNKEKNDTIDKYIKGSNENEIYDVYDEKQNELHFELKEEKDKYHCEVKVGTIIERIKNISSSTSTYEARMQLFFYFDKEDFQKMFRHYASLFLWDQILNDYYSSCDEKELENTRDLNFEQFINNPYYKDEHNLYFENWIINNDHRYYPGECPSNVLVDNETMFEIGNGEFIPDSYGTIKSLEEIPYENGIMCYQKVKFTARFEKYFNSVRYPLDSIQFKMYISPIMDSQYIRYVPNREKDKYGNNISGFSSYFGLTEGYRLVKESKDIKNFTLRIHYYDYVNNEPTESNNIKTELEIIVRANRGGLQLFLQAFINLFSVLIWISIAFYNQAFNHKNSLDMLGTGMFGVISSMVIGLSLLSDSGIFSLITMLNIFTFAIILYMTYLSIAFSRSKIINDKNTILYHSLKLKFMFYVLITSIVIMFIGLPLMSYIFSL